MKAALWRRELLLVTVIVLVAVFFRTFKLDSLPRGMIADEAQRGLEALAIAHGGYYPVFLTELGAFPMYAYWLAILFRFFGASLLTARAGAALIGIATVPVFYLLVRGLFPSKGGRSGRVLALSATFFLATSYWHVVYSRVAREMILLPFFAILVSYCFLQAWRSARRPYFVLCGVSMGLGLYTYASSLCLPLLVVVPLGHYIWREKGSLRTQFINVLMLFGIGFTLAAPLALFALRETDIFMQRPNEVTLLNRELTGGSPLAAFVVSSARTAATFIIQGDPSLVHNPASRPVLDPIASLWFVLGLCVTIRKWREPAHFMLLTWLLIMCLPAAVTVLPSADFSRAIGSLPVACILPALGMVTAWEWFEARTAANRAVTIIGTSVVAITLLFTAATTYRDYFMVWDTREDLRRGYDGAYTEAATVMNQKNLAGSVWILPHTPFVPSGYGSDHIDFLYHGEAPYFSVSLDETTAPAEISDICRERRRASVLDWKEYVQEEAYKAMTADPKGLLPFLFRKYGAELKRSSYETFDLVTYKLAPLTPFAIAESFEPMEVDFGDELMLTGVAFGGSSLQDTSTPEEVERRQLPSGKTGWVVLRWRATREPSRSYKVAVYLEDQGGHIAGQVDKLLLSNYLHTTSDWHSGQEEIDYYTLPSWSGSAPGWYTVGVTVYDASSGDVLYPRDGKRSYQLGMMEIVRPLAPGQVEPEMSVEAEEGEIAGSIRLLGYDLPRRELSPGDELSVALYWQAIEDVNRDYLLAVQLTDKQGVVWGEEFDAPVYGSYPTTEWEKGEVLRDWHNLRLPADTPTGDYELSLRVLEGGRTIRQASLGRVQVLGRPHQFDVPEIQHPLEARLGDGVLFLGYDLSGEDVKPGDTMHLTLYWQALSEMQVSYTAFTHLLDANERTWGQTDSVPLRSEAPTTSWISGEVIADEYDIAVDAGAPPGDYAIEIGMYDASTGQRLAVFTDRGREGGDRLLLGKVTIVP